MKKIAILIADDHKLMRMGLAALISVQKDMAVAGEVEDGEEAVRLARELKPDVVIMDLLMPKADGVEATRLLHVRAPRARVLVLTSCATSDGIAQALEAGAAGAVMKTAENAELVAAIRKVAAGERYVSPEIQRLMDTDPPVAPLTERQREVLHSLTRGLTNRDIASQLGISVRSVEEHVNNLLEKIGATNRAEAVGIALRKRLLKA